MFKNHNSLKTVCIVLENCEWYEFKADDINLTVQDLGMNIWGERVFNKAEHILLTIQNSAIPIKNETPSDEKWQERIDRDITQIELNFEDGIQYTIWPEWSDESAYVNYYEQDNHYDHTMEIIISPTRKTADEFYK